MGRTLSDLSKTSKANPFRCRFGKLQTKTSQLGTLGSVRQGRLRVDATRGAGVELRACPAGYRVLRVERVPGQPDLRTGDTIVAMEGLMLAGCEEQEIERRFGSAFVHGAALTIAEFPAYAPAPATFELHGDKLSCVDLGQVPPPVKTIELWDDSLSEKPPSLHWVSLRVDETLGAGLELATCSAGYMVKDVDPAPGQLDLHVGSTIVAIDGVILIGLVADEVEIAFGEAFKDGAQLLVSEDASCDLHDLRIIVGEMLNKA